MYVYTHQQVITPISLLCICHHTVITLLLTIFLVLYFTSPWLFKIIDIKYYGHFRRTAQWLDIYTTYKVLDFSDFSSSFCFYDVTIGRNSPCGSSLVLLHIWHDLFFLVLFLVLSCLPKSSFVQFPCSEIFYFWFSCSVIACIIFF